MPELSLQEDIYSEVAILCILVFHFLCGPGQPICPVKFPSLGCFYSPGRFIRVSIWSQPFNYLILLILCPKIGQVLQSGRLSLGTRQICLRCGDWFATIYLTYWNSEFNSWERPNPRFWSLNWGLHFEVAALYIMVWIYMVWQLKPICSTRIPSCDFL